MDVDKHVTGSFCNAMLRTRDIRRAAAFSAALVGCTVREVPNAGGRHLLQSRGKTVAASQQIPEGVDAWVPHVEVGNLERTVLEAAALGATLADRLDIPGVLSNDVEGARNSYQRLFGWSSTDTSFEPFSRYAVFKRGDVQEGGILRIEPDWSVSPRWNSIFAVMTATRPSEKQKRLAAHTCSYVPSREREESGCQGSWRCAVRDPSTSAGRG